MLAKARLLLSLLSFTAVSATPVHHRLEDVQCRCLSFSTTAKPTLCTYLDFRGLDWQTAYSLASENNLKIQFTSQDTISKVLAIPKPLPSSVLASLGRGEALPPASTNLIQRENKIVCGLGDEVKHIGNGTKDLVPGDHCVGLIAGVLMLFIILYAAGDYAWRRHSGPPEGSIKLQGDEKTLSAKLEDTTTTDVVP